MEAATAGGIASPSVVDLFVGCFLDPASALIMLTPLLAPIAEGEALRLNVLLTISGQHRAFTFWTTVFVPVALFERMVE